ncbi:FecR family protein [Caulobacter sp.]|uniref:FecR family protein n=1 Tax=Caulobacter sp. TaxID=78 RepID=UPI003BAF5E64
MNASDKNAARGSLESQGLAWINRLTSGLVTADEAEAFVRWRAESPAHEEAFTEAAQLRRAVREAVTAERAEAAADLRARASRSSRSSPLMNRRALLGGAVAASAVAYMVARPPAGLWSSWAELNSDLRTAPGERRSVAVADGVSVELNTRTSVSLRHQDGRLELALLSGEAVVSAATAASAPAIVTAQDGTTTASQGRFNIHHDRDAVCVTCLAGETRVEAHGKQVVLPTGGQVTYTRKAINAPQTVDPALAASWIRGLLVFRDAPLQQVIDEINRYRRGKIILVDPTLAQRPVYGVFQISRIAGAVEQVRRLTGAHASYLPAGVVLLS